MRHCLYGLQDLSSLTLVFTDCKSALTGKIFHEQGGYKDDSTRFDRIVKWAKNNKFLAWVLIAFVVISALIGFVVSLIAVYEFFKN